MYQNHMDNGIAYHISNRNPSAPLIKKINDLIERGFLTPSKRVEHYSDFIRESLETY